MEQRSKHETLQAVGTIIVCYGVFAAIIMSFPIDWLMKYYLLASVAVGFIILSAVYFLRKKDIPVTEGNLFLYKILGITLSVFLVTSSLTWLSLDYSNITVSSFEVGLIGFLIALGVLVGIATAIFSKKYSRKQFNS